MRLENFENDIHAIAKANGNPQFSNAVDMFLNNIKDAGDALDQYHYAGADHLDYAALKPYLKEFEDAKEAFIADR